MLLGLGPQSFCGAGNFQLPGPTGVSRIFVGQFLESVSIGGGNIDMDSAELAPLYVFSGKGIVVTGGTEILGERWQAP